MPPILVGAVINPTFVSRTNWQVVLAQPRARLVWLRRTNLVKMALSDLRRVRDAKSSGGGGGGAVAAGADELLAKVNATLRSQVAFPGMLAGDRLDDGFLLLYEDLQARRLEVLRALFGFLGVAHAPAVAAELGRQQAADAAAATTHWRKASEDACAALPPGRCDALAAELHEFPCVLAQLRSARPEPFTFPLARAGALALALRGGTCDALRPLGEARCHSRSLLELYGFGGKAGCAWPGVRATATAVVATANVSRGFDPATAWAHREGGAAPPRVVERRSEF